MLYPGHVQLPGVPRGTPDGRWLRLVGELGLVVLIAAGNVRVSELLELLDAHWIEMEQTARDLPDGPWMFAVTRRRITRIALDR